MPTEEASASLLDRVNSVVPEPKAAAPPLIVTMNEIPGYDIDAVCGDVFGLVVMSRHALCNVGASLKTVVGGEIHGYTELLPCSRNQARERLWREAVAVGANAVCCDAIRLKHDRRRHDGSGCLWHRRQRDQAN